MRPLALALLFPLVATAQPPDFPAPKTFPPDDATLKQIKDKTAELKKATEKVTDPDVLVYLKAAEWIVKHGEWYTDKSAAQTLAVLDAGLERAKNVEKKPWLDVRGKPVVRGYESMLDYSVQPYSVRFPDDYDPKKKYRLDVVLHGRDASLTEVKFIAGKEAAKKGKPLDHFEVEVYGRGNNAYRWAGEADVFDVITAVQATGAVDEKQVVLRGFSMGGAGTWHIGLHHPFVFAVIGPGAGFSTTREYIGNKKFGTQPDYIEKCLHIYDAVDYAENVFNVPVVAYSGEKDKQKLAADLIEAKLKDFKEPHNFTHVVAPGLEHSQPADWQAKLELEYQKHLKEPPAKAEQRCRFVTYTPKYTGGDPKGGFNVSPLAQEKQYEKTVVDGVFKDGKVVISTVNTWLVAVSGDSLDGIRSLTIDGQEVAKEKGGFPFPLWLKKEQGKWQISNGKDSPSRQKKSLYWRGPIDDAFTSEFQVVTLSEKPWHEETGAFAAARHMEFAVNWDKYFRGELAYVPEKVLGKSKKVGGTVALFGDPHSNPVIAEMLPKLPITWTEDELVVNGKKYDPKTHLPVLIYPNPFSTHGYVVINSGHTFREADLKGTNALLYPRLGDWAVLKPKPTKDDPAGFEVVDAGLFDENWQFSKKK